MSGYRAEHLGLDMHKQVRRPSEVLEAPFPRDDGQYLHGITSKGQINPNFSPWPPSPEPPSYQHLHSLANRPLLDFRLSCWEQGYPFPHARARHFVILGSGIGQAPEHDRYGTFMQQVSDNAGCTTFVFRMRFYVHVLPVSGAPDIPQLW